MGEAFGHGANLLARRPPPRRIAVVRAARLGDFVCAGPALRALRAAVPEAEITLITLPYLRELTHRLPFVDRFAPFPGFPGVAEQLFDARAAVEFLRRMQDERFDLAVQLHGSGVYTNPFTLLLGARATAGFVRAEDGPGRLDAALPWPTRGHETARLLALMRHIGADARGEDLYYPLTDADRATADRLLAGLPRPLIGLHAGSHDARRRWPAANFVQIARTLRRESGGGVVVLGAAPEAADAAALARAIGRGARNLAGRTDLGTLGGAIAALDLLIANDSGPLHIGYALSTPTVGIYRAHGCDRYGPPPRGPFVALEPDAPDDDALVGVGAVLDAARRLLDASRYAPTETAACASAGRSTLSAE